MNKILIVDDSILDRKLAMNVLNKANIRNDILQAIDGEDGIRLLSEHLDEVCLILLDWQMPKMDGLEFMRAVRQVPEAACIPVIMITASGSHESKRIAWHTNPDLAGYIVKPYNPEVLVENVRNHIDGDKINT